MASNPIRGGGEPAESDGHSPKSRFGIRSQPRSAAEIAEAASQKRERCAEEGSPKSGALKRRRDLPGDIYPLPSTPSAAETDASQRLRSFWRQVTPPPAQDGGASLPAGLAEAYTQWVRAVQGRGGRLAELDSALLEFQDQPESFLDESKAFRTRYLEWTNPHLVQVFRQSEKYRYAVSAEAVPRVLAADSPRRAYRRRNDEMKTLVHWGQRKLLMSEIEFLTRHAPRGTPMLAIYAGAAPGTHIPLLRDLFPDVAWVLVDPAPFTCRPVEGEIQLVPDLCTLELIERLRDEAEAAGQETLLISDIRSADWEKLDEVETDRRIREDMAMQMRWHQVLRPCASMFKFRLPWSDGHTEYLAGDVYLPVWGPLTTTETRLVVKRDAGTRMYEHRAYEEQMFHFNTVVRCSAFEHALEDCRVEGLDFCYDCAAEASILCAYHASAHPNASDSERTAWATAMVQRISLEISFGNRHLRDPNPDPRRRKEVIQRRQYVDGDAPYERARRANPHFASHSNDPSFKRNAVIYDPI